METKPLRFGVLGCSRVAQKSTIPALLDSDLTSVSAIGSRQIETAQTCADKFHIEGSGTYTDILERDDVDAVYLSLPNVLHEEWTIKAIEAGKHVWCEKPAAMTFSSARKITDHAKKRGVLVTEGFPFLFHPQHKKVNGLVSEGAVGDVTTFHGQFSYPMPELGNIRLNLSLGGGIYADAAVYPIRASRMIFNEEPESIFCTLIKNAESGVDVKADMVLTFSKNKTAHISVAFDAYFQSTYSALGSSGMISVERAYAVPSDKDTKIFLNRNDETETFNIGATNQFKKFAENFASMVGNKEKWTMSANDLLAQARVFDAGLKSNKERRVVSIAEIN